VPAPLRAEILFKAAQIIAARKEEFARDMTREMGKVLNETRGDVQEAIDMTFYMAGEGGACSGRPCRRSCATSSRCRSASRSASPRSSRRGIFPMAIPSWKIIPGAGLRQHRRLQALVADAAVGAQLRQRPDRGRRAEGGRQHGHGDAEVGTVMTTDPAVRIVSFTGSTNVGRIVNQAAAPTFKKVHLEMGGKNVVMIMDDANLELAVDGCLWGGFGTTGQRCTAASRVVVHEKVYKAFVDAFVARVQTLVVGDGLQPESRSGRRTARRSCGRS
jgi:aldehyde dehydrogenase (NAD+)